MGQHFNVQWMCQDSRGIKPCKFIRHWISLRPAKSDAVDCLVISLFFAGGKKRTNNPRLIPPFYHVAHPPPPLSIMWHILSFLSCSTSSPPPFLSCSTCWEHSLPGRYRNCVVVRLKVFHGVWRTMGLENKASEKIRDTSITIVSSLWECGVLSS